MTLTKEVFSSKLRRVFELNGLEEYTDVEKVDAFYSLTRMLCETNGEMNLTAINDPSEVISKHLADSLLAVKLYKTDAKIIDIGCGAGFPSLPLAIARKDLSITALDSTGKKIAFVERTAKALGLNGIQAVCGRAEEYVATPGMRESFDHATARAVSRLNVLCELALPFVKLGGSFIALKAKEGENELAEAKSGIAKLGAKLGELRHAELVTLEEESFERTLITLEKISPTPVKYPRAYAKITKKPI